MTPNFFETSLNANDILTQVHRFNLIRDGRLVYVDVHEALAGSLAAPFVAVPNLVNIVARQEFQGTGGTIWEALGDCLKKIKDHSVEALFPHKE